MINSSAGRAARIFMTGLFALAVIAALLAAPVPAGAATPEYFVAPGGTGAACSRTAPCALETAQAKIRSGTGSMTGDLVVNLGGGTYRRTAPFALSAVAGDGGTGGHRVIYQADHYGTPEQAKPVISGGRVITGWTKLDGDRNLWRAPVGELRTRQLYVNGRRADRAGQSTGLAGKVEELTESGDGGKRFLGYRTDDPLLRTWRNPDQLEFVYNGGGKNGNFQWAEPRCQVKSIKADGDATVIMMKQPCFQLTSELRGADGITFPTAVENAYELLDRPGEWYLDPAEQQVYYLPRAGEDPATAEIVAPVAERLFTGTGTADRSLTGITVRGLTFADAGYRGPDGDAGFPEDSLNLTYAKLGPGERHLDFWSVGIKNVQLPAAVTVGHAEELNFDGNTFTRLGGAGLTLDNGSRRNRVARNVFTDISGQGVQVGNVDVAADSGPDVVIDNAVIDNYLARIAVEFHGGYGIWIAAAGRTTVSRNYLTDLPRGGIASNHAYSYGDTINYGQVITDNVITEWGKVIADGGGFDSNGPQNGPDGKQPNTLLAGNVFSHATRGFGQIYLDWWSKGFTVENNVMYDSSYRSAMLRLAASGAPCCNLVRHNYGDKVIAWGHNDLAVDNSILPVSAMPASVLATAGPAEPAFDTLRRAARTTVLDELRLPAFPGSGSVGTPAGFAAGNAKPGPVIPLSWQPVAGASGYEVDCSGPGPRVRAAVPGDRTNATLEGLRPGERLECAVLARNAAGALSRPSNSVLIKVPGPAGLAGRWDFAGDGATAADSSGAGNAAKLWQLAGHYEAEDGTGSGTCSGPTGGEYYPSHHGTAAVSCFGPGAKQSVTVEVPAAGTYTLDFRYAASREGGWDPDGSRTLSLYVNGARVDQLRFGWTGSWGSPQDLFTETALAAGENTIELRVDAGDRGWISYDSLNVLRPLAGRDPGVLPLDGRTTAWVGTQPALGFDTGSLTVAARFRSTGQARQRLLGKGFLRDNSSGYGLLLEGGRLRFGIGTNWQEDAPPEDSPRKAWEKPLDVSTTERFTDGTWHDVAVVINRKAGTAVILVDGRPRSLIAKPGLCAAATGRAASLTGCPRIAAAGYDPLIIGSYNASSDYATGAVDDVAVWGRALTPAELRDLR